MPVILTECSTLPTREDVPHDANYAAAGELLQGGREVRVRDRRPHNARHAALSGGAVGGVGAAERRGDQGADDQRRRDPRRRRPDRQHRRRQDRQPLIVDGDPLEIRTTITNVIINGRDVGLENKHWLLWQRFMAEVGGGSMTKKTFIPRFRRSRLLAIALQRGRAAGTYAIRGAKIVPRSGAPIASGNIVLRNGLIEAVGASVGRRLTPSSSTAPGSPCTRASSTSATPRRSPTERRGGAAPRGARQSPSSSAGKRLRSCGPSAAQASVNVGSRPS